MKRSGSMSALQTPGVSDVLSPILLIQRSGNARRANNEETNVSNGKVSKKVGGYRRLLSLDVHPIIPKRFSVSATSRYLRNVSPLVN